MSLNITISKISEAMTQLTRLSSGLGDRLNLHQAIGLELREATDRRFRRGVDPDGRPWPKSMRAYMQGGQTLRDTGLLQSSVTFQADRRGLDFGVIGSNLKYARIHQYGGVIRPKKAKALTFALADGTFVQVKKVVMPARPYIGISTEDEAGLVALTIEYMQRLMKNG